MEQSVELIVFLGIGMILLALMTGFIYMWNIKEDVGSTLSLYEGNRTDIGIKMDVVAFMAQARDYWDYCNHSSAPTNRTMYVSSNGTLNKTVLFDYYKSLSWCSSIQSVNQSCGRREDVNISDIALPAVVHISCRNQMLFIERG